MEEKHRSRLKAEHPRLLQHKALYVLGIPDEYRFMDPELVELLEETAGPIFDRLLEP